MEELAPRLVDALVGVGAEEVALPLHERGRSGVERVRVVWPDGTTMRGDGHYHEAYVKVDGEWRITASTLTRLRMDLTGPVP